MSVLGFAGVYGFNNSLFSGYLNGTAFKFLRDTSVIVVVLYLSLRFRSNFQVTDPYILVVVIITKVL